MHRSEKEAFESKNEGGDTPLHLAATGGLKNICECIIGNNGERKHLITIDNNEGETPLFHAALLWQKQAFVYLCSLMPAEEINYYKDLIRKNGDSILHCAIRREFFDLALIIMYRYPKLYDIQNREGYSPLKLLATRPSAFKSGVNLTMWERLLYHCVTVETLDVKKAEELYMKADESQKQIPGNYDTCCRFLRAFHRRAIVPIYLIFALRNKGMKQEDLEEHKMPEDFSRELVPQNYETCLQFMKLACMHFLGLCGLAGVGDIRKMKQKHKWSDQLLSAFMKTPYESYTGSGGPPPLDEGVQTDFISAYKKGVGDTRKMKQKHIWSDQLLSAFMKTLMSRIQEVEVHHHWTKVFKQISFLLTRKLKVK
ncbi:Ankyrin repeat-containing protein [Spatholobus suberectus]|nr:Ankyrin repeat-containing protein [Spatholobus suberectus]